MNRLHLHVSVDDLSRSIRFYETLFGAPPTVLKPDYAKWMLEDPRVNFAISTRGGTPGMYHRSMYWASTDATSCSITVRPKGSRACARMVLRSRSPFFRMQHTDNKAVVWSSGTSAVRKGPRPSSPQGVTRLTAPL